MVSISWINYKKAQGTFIPKPFLCLLRTNISRADRMVSPYLISKRHILKKELGEKLVGAEVDKLRL